MDAVQDETLITVMFCNYCGKSVKIYTGDRINPRCPYCKGIMQDKNIPQWNQLDIVEKENLLIDWKQQARESKQLNEQLFEKRNRSRIRKQKYKVLGSYLASFLISSLFVFALQHKGIILGGIPTTIIYLIAFFMARLLSGIL